MWIVLLLWSSTLVIPALAGLSVALLSQSCESTWQSELKGSVPQAHMSLKVRWEIFLILALDPVLVLVAFSFAVWFSGVPWCQWEHEVRPLLLWYKMYQSIVMSHGSVEHRKEGYQIVLKLQGKVKKAKLTLLSLECTWDICCQA